MENIEKAIRKGFESDIWVKNHYLWTRVTNTAIRNLPPHNSLTYSTLETTITRIIKRELHERRRTEKA